MKKAVKEHYSVMGVQIQPESCTFRVWAPNAGEVYVVGTFNNWSKTQNPLKKELRGYWYGEVKDAKPGHEYKYRIVGASGELLKNDPYARIVTSSAGNSVISDSYFDWGKKRFEIPHLNKLVIYELHIGTFAKEPGDTPGNLEIAIKRLPYLEELGINAIEIMPIMEFAGGYSWGYNPSNIFAIENEYGPPVCFKHFVKSAHEKGIAVILDVVYNHFGPSDLDLWQFDGWSENNKGGIYFYNDWRSKTPWGDTRPDYGHEEVRNFICDNAVFWIKEYDIDGLRFDATSFIRNVHGRDNDPQADLADGWSLLQFINDEIKKRKPGAFLIAEDLQDNAFITKETKDGGAGFTTQWDAHFVHRIRQALIGSDDSERNMDEIRDAVLHRFYLNAFERVIYTESHDEVANGKARVPEEVAPGNAANWFAKKKSCLGAALVFTSPGIPMIFQGQEFLEDDWFHDKDPIDWTKKDRFAGILKAYRDLIRLRLNKEGFTGGLCEQNVSVFHVNNEDKVLCFYRWDKDGTGDSVVVAVNFANQSYSDYFIGLPHEGEWKVCFNSDAKAYNSEFNNLVCPDVIAENQGQDGLPYRGKITIAPYSCIILSGDKQGSLK